MALKLMGEGDTEEDDEATHVIKRMLGKGKGKGKQRGLGQQRDHEPCLQIIFKQRINS